MENINLKQTRVSVGCRITLEKKNELLVKAKENGFTSLSQYLEVLILRALNSELEQEIKPNAILTEKDFEIIEQRFSNALYKQKLNDPEINSEKRLNDVLTKLSLLSGGLDQESHNEFIRVLKKDDLDYEELLEQIINIESIEDSAKEEATKNLLPFTFSVESKKLIIEYINFLVQNNYATNEENALVEIINSAFQRGGIFDGEMAGNELFANLFQELGNNSSKLEK